MSEMLALESGEDVRPAPRQDSFWMEQSVAGMVEIDGRRENGVDIRVLWQEVGNLVLLGATTDQGETALTVIEPDRAKDSLEHPANYFSGDASSRIFGKAA